MVNNIFRFMLNVLFSVEYFGDEFILRFLWSYI